MPTPPERSDAITTWKRWAFGPKALDRMLLYEELATQAGAGFGIRESVENLRARSSGPRLRALERFADAVACDLPPGEAMLRFPESFAPVEARMVSTGERTGRYDRAFRDAAGEVLRTRTAAQKIVRGIAYPVFLLHFALFVPGCAVLNAFRGPRTAATFVLSVFTLFWASAFLVTTLHLQHRASLAWGRFVARIPFAGEVSRSAAVSRACRVAAALHDAGADLPSTLSLAAEAAGNGWVAADLRTAAELVAEGRPVAQALSVVGALQSESHSLLRTGEGSGALTESFGRIAQIEDERFDAAVRRLAVWMSVGLVLLVGLVVFLMLSSLFSRLYRF